MDFRRGRDDAIADEFHRFLQKELPPQMRGQRFAWAFDKNFHKIFTAWQLEHLSDASEATLATFVDQLFWSDLDLRTTGPTGLVAAILSVVGTEEQKAELLPKFESGEALAALGYTEPDSGSDVAAARTRAIRDGDDWIINGQKMYTSNAEISDYVFLLTRTNTEVRKHKGLTMFIVPLDTPGIEIRPIETLRGHSTAMTYYTDVRVPDSARVGDVDAGWTVMRMALDAEHGSGSTRMETRLAGAVSYGARFNHLLDRAVDWAANTRDENGVRRIDDPIVRRCLARTAISVEVARLLAGRTDAEAHKPGVGNGLKLFATESYLRASDELLELAGPSGVIDFTNDDSPAGGWLEYSFRDAPVSTIAGGSSEVQRDVIAERRLGLPTARVANRGHENPP